jgi:hypothetical protein
MNDVFERRVASAAVALWRAVLLDAGLLLVSGIAYFGIIHTRPAWYISLWGPEVSWASIQNVWLWSIVIIELMALQMAFVALWLTLWARQLRTMIGRP